MVEIFYLFNCRSLNDSLRSLGFFSNPWVLWGAAAMIAAQLLFTYAPFMNRLFHTAPIAAEAWLHILAVGSPRSPRWARRSGSAPGWNGVLSSFAKVVGATRSVPAPPAIVWSDGKWIKSSAESGSRIRDANITANRTFIPGMMAIICEMVRTSLVS